MFKATVRSILAASLLASAVSVTNTHAQSGKETVEALSKALDALIEAEGKAVGGIKEAAGSARDAMSWANPVNDEVFMRAEYVYLTVLYADLISARTVGEWTKDMNFTVSVLGAEANIDIANYTTKAVLLSPAVLTAASLYRNRLARVTYAIPEAKGFAKDFLAYLGSYSKNPLLSWKTAKVNVKMAARTLVRASATTVNYALIGGAVVLADESSRAVFMSAQELEQKTKEVESRLKQLESEMADLIAIGHQVKDTVSSINQ